MNILAENYFVDEMCHNVDDAASVSRSFIRTCPIMLAECLVSAFLFVVGGLIM